MNPAGIIITYIDWSKWKKWFFNIPLFLFQLTFMVVGTAIGKIKWAKLERWQDRIVGVILTWILAISIWFIPEWWDIPVFIVCVLVGVATIRNIDWRRVWRAAQASHVRLCLKKAEATLDTWQYINFGYPEAKLDYWRMEQCDGKRFEYREPTFALPPEAIDEMIDYAEGEVGKPYDKLQLLSPAINFVIWITWWPDWGKELIKWANQPGGAEFCSSGVTACLRWAIKAIYTMWFFLGYDTAMVMPCMFVISEKWREV